MKWRRIGQLSLLGGFLSLPAFGQEPSPEWELRREREGIQVYTRDVSDSPYDEVLSRTLVEGVTLSSMVALIQDAEACSNWADRCADSYVQELLSETEAYVYTHNDLPFPVRDRDVVSHVLWRQDAGSLEVVMESVAVAGILPESDGKLRLTEAMTTWRFRPLPDGAIEVTNRAHINPGSRLPGWITNMLLVDTPFETIRAFVAELENPKYRDARFDFVTEPPS